MLVLIRKGFVPVHLSHGPKVSSCYICLLLLYITSYYTYVYVYIYIFIRFTFRRIIRRNVK